MIQERPEYHSAKILSGVAAKLYRSQLPAVEDLLAVVPWPHNQKDLVIAGVLWLYRLINGRGSIDVFLVPETVNQHYRNLNGLRAKNLVHRLVTPKRIVGRV